MNAAAGFVLPWEAISGYILDEVGVAKGGWGWGDEVGGWQRGGGGRGGREGRDGGILGHRDNQKCSRSRGGGVPGMRRGKISRAHVGQRVELAEGAQGRG